MLNFGEDFLRFLEIIFFPSTINMICDFLKIEPTSCLLEINPTWL